MMQCAAEAHDTPNWSCCAFYRMTRFLHATLKREEVVEEVLDVALEVTRAERALLLLEDEKMEQIAVAGVRKMDGDTVERVRELCRRTLKGKEPKKGVTPILEGELAQQLTTLQGEDGSHLCIPLWGCGKVIGGLYLDHPEESGLFPRSFSPFYSALADQISTAFLNARRYTQLQQENAQLRQRVESGDRFLAILGDSEPMRKMKRMLAKVIDSPASVLINGESGTGKELVARALHFEGPRRNKSFVAENCAALPETLLESELFGHAKGAYTGATQEKPGLFEMADGGTLFLDEIADTSPTVQAKLLRVLENGEIRRLGETQVRKVDVRIVAATSRDLMREVEEERFRAELYYRLSVLHVNLPPLRERSDDVPLLVGHFLDDYAERTGKRLPGFEPEVLAVMQGYHWPGNVRQLRNETERMAALVDAGKRISFELLSDELRGIQPSAASLQEGEALPAALERIKKTMIEQALTACDGNRTKAAEVLGISRPNLQKTMKRLGVA